jgi:hypothetical protein
MSLESTLVALPNLNQINYALIRRLSDLRHGVNAVCAHTPKINWYSRPNPSKDTTGRFPDAAFGQYHYEVQQ